MCSELEEKLADLLKAGICFLFDQTIVDEEEPLEVRGKKAATIWVNCNDLFYWACADAEPLPRDQIAKLWEMHKKPAGVTKWSCQSRNMQPQKPIVEDLKKRGHWDDEFEALPKAPPS